MNLYDKLASATNPHRQHFFPTKKRRLNLKTLLHHKLFFACKWLLSPNVSTKIIVIEHGCAYLTGCQLPGRLEKIRYLDAYGYCYYSQFIPLAKNEGNYLNSTPYDINHATPPIPIPTDPLQDALNP